jgi:hypothetical protein
MIWWLDRYQWSVLTYQITLPNHACCNPFLLLDTQQPRFEISCEAHSITAVSTTELQWTSSRKRICARHFTAYAIKDDQPGTHPNKIYQPPMYREEWEEPPYSTEMQSRTNPFVH